MWLQGAEQRQASHQGAMPAFIATVPQACPDNLNSNHRRGEQRMGSPNAAVNHGQDWGIGSRANHLR